MQDVILQDVMACVMCRAPSNKRCGRCQQVCYCSVKHQTEHWPAHKTDCGFRQLTSKESGAFLDWMSANATGTSELRRVSNVVYSTKVVRELMSALVDMGEKSELPERPIRLYHLLGVLVQQAGPVRSDCALACLLLMFYARKKTALDRISFSFPLGNQTEGMVFVTTNLLDKIQSQGLVRVSFAGQWIYPVNHSTEYWGLSPTGICVASREKWGARLVAMHSRLLLGESETLHVMRTQDTDLTEAPDEILEVMAITLHHRAVLFVENGGTVQPLFLS